MSLNLVFVKTEGFIVKNVVLFIIPSQQISHVWYFKITSVHSCGEWRNDFRCSQRSACCCTVVFIVKVKYAFSHLSGKQKHSLSGGGYDKQVTLGKHIVKHTDTCRHCGTDRLLVSVSENRQQRTLDSWTFWRTMSCSSSPISNTFDKKEKATKDWINSRETRCFHVKIGSQLQFLLLTKNLRKKRWISLIESHLTHSHHWHTSSWEHSLHTSRSHTSHAHQSLAKHHLKRRYITAEYQYTVWQDLDFNQVWADSICSDS